MRFPTFLATGLAYGSTSALVAAGFLVLHRATGVFDFAHGDLMVLDAFLAYWAVRQEHLPVRVGYLVAIVLLGGAGGLLERLAYAPLRRHPVMVVVDRRVISAWNRGSWVCQSSGGNVRRSGGGTADEADGSGEADPVGVDVGGLGCLGDQGGDRVLDGQPGPHLLDG
ncbi:hypothetical protein MXD95_007550 [Frankia sp. AiPa1]|nr:hypothetical protein [Frankia sp. AiPa1]